MFLILGLIVVTVLFMMFGGNQEHTEESGDSEVQQVDNNPQILYRTHQVQDDVNCICEMFYASLDEEALGEKLANLIIDTNEKDITLLRHDLNLEREDFSGKIRIETIRNWKRKIKYTCVSVMLEFEETSIMKTFKAKDKFMYGVTCSQMGLRKAICKATVFAADQITLRENDKVE